MKISTIGGNVKGKLRRFARIEIWRHAQLRDGSQRILPNGEVMWLGNKCVKDVAGYSLKDLFIGSEGTLGVITKVLLRLIPKPAAKKTMVATFAQMDQAAESVSAIIAAQVIPCTLEFLDRMTIHCVEDYAEDRPAAGLRSVVADGNRRSSGGCGRGGRADGEMLS